MGDEKSKAGTQGFLSRAKGFAMALAERGAALYNGIMSAALGLRFLHTYYETPEAFLGRMNRKYWHLDEARFAAMLESSPRAVLGAEATAAVLRRRVQYHAIRAALATFIATIPTNWIMWPLIAVDLVWFQHEMFLFSQEAYMLYKPRTEYRRVKFDYATVTSLVALMLEHVAVRQAKSGLSMVSRQLVKRGARAFRGPLQALIRQGLKWLGVVASRDLAAQSLDATVVLICSLIASCVSYWLFVPTGKRMVKALTAADEVVAAKAAKAARIAEKRVVFLDYLRVAACFMVLLVHCCEQYYFNDKGEFAIASAWDAGWLVWIDSACRAAVPLFVMASAYLLFPVARPTGEFFRRRLLRVAVPFAVWACVYNWANDGSWGQMLFNFPMATGGHLWFVPMLLGLYLLMPLLSPWAEKVKEKELLGWLGLWGFTTLFPYLRRLWGALYGAPDFGAVPYLWGECPWNGFGMFQYVSGFVGYLLLGFWFRKFAGSWSWRKTLVRAVPLHLAGWALVALPFLLRIPAEGGYPVVRPYATAVDLEMSWEFCSLGVAMTVTAYFMVVRKFVSTGGFYQWVVRPLSEASYGTYLVHILILVPVVGGVLKPHLPTPCAIVLGAAATFLLSSFASLLLRRIPKVGRFLG